jgi:ubiquinone/menaquinone biosynthesis C-methylase UbiE
MNYENRYQKWEEVAKKYKVDNSRIATFKLTIQNVLRLLKNKKEGLALDVGCGFGYIDILLAKNTNFRIIAIDISDIALEAARKTVQREGFEHRIKVERGDIYNLDYPDNYFDIIFSFGYASAATYPNARKEVCRVLKPGGILICDFINHRSLYKIFFLPKNLILGYAKTREITGIKNKFKKDGFEFVSCRYFNTFPPIFKKNIPPDIYIFFEKTVGRLLRPVLARTTLFCFRKN